MQQKSLGMSVLLCCLFTTSGIAAQPVKPPPNLPAVAVRPGVHVYAPALGARTDGLTPKFLSTPMGFTPLQVRHIYGFDTIVADGAGQTIALVEANYDPSIENDLGVFSAQFALPACTSQNGCFTQIFLDANGNPTSTPPANADPGWNIETALDVEWAHAIAPAAKIVLVESYSSDFFDLLNGVIAASTGTNFVSMSWGTSEFPEEVFVDSIFQYFPNNTYFAASGDSGNFLGYPAASPYVIAVGGTTLAANPTNEYLNESAWSQSGGGISAYEPLSLGQTMGALPNNPNGGRGVPDVAYDGDPMTGMAIFSSQYYPGEYQWLYGWFQIGGTSLGCPQWAATMALVDAARTTAKKAPIYNVAVSSALYQAPRPWRQPFRDITVGANGICGPLCVALPGYDYVTGLGTPNFSGLFDYLTQY